eukprot:TRINITY_DN2087_c0_g1_i1.p1 TRINITY_DN2087_c0_g1~~TRINITY_DN2087_c0_g1_i1.p1  ORF type:complete len:278 (-),score=29.03 TRINITY_DN2087_c0_g1_i1:120-953(-)
MLKRILFNSSKIKYFKVNKYKFGYMNILKINKNYRYLLEDGTKIEQDEPMAQYISEDGNDYSAERKGEDNEEKDYINVYRGGVSSDRPWAEEFQFKNDIGRYYFENLVVLKKLLIASTNNTEDLIGFLKHADSTEQILSVLDRLLLKRQLRHNHKIYETIMKRKDSNVELVHRCMGVIYSNIGLKPNIRFVQRLFQYYKNESEIKYIINHILTCKSYPKIPIRAKDVKLFASTSPKNLDLIISSFEKEPFNVFLTDKVKQGLYTYKSKQKKPQTKKL